MWHCWMIPWATQHYNQLPFSTKIVEYVATKLSIKCLETSQEVLTKMINPFWETIDFTRKSLHDHFTQSIYVVRHSLYYPLSTLANTSSHLYWCYVKNLRKGFYVYLTLCLSSYVCMYPHKIVFKKYQFIIFNGCLNICTVAAQQ